MRHNWKWLAGIGAGVLILWLLPRLYTELLPVNSAALLREARAAALTAEHDSHRVAAIAHLARAPAHSGDLQLAQRFTQTMPSDLQLLLYQEMAHALLDQNQLSEALQFARELDQLWLRSPRRSQYDTIADTSMLLPAYLFQRLTQTLIAEGRLEEAADALLMLPHYAKAHSSIDAYRYLFLYRAAQAGQYEPARRVLKALPIKESSHIPWLQLAALAVQKGDWQAAERWIQQYEKRELTGYDDTVALQGKPLPLEWMARLRPVERLARSGRTGDALRLAERTLRHYLRTSHPDTIDYDLLMRTALHLTTLLPADALRSMLQRLPTERYECAETHLWSGFALGLAMAGRRRELERTLPALPDAATRQKVSQLLLLTLARKGDADEIERQLQTMPERSSIKPALRMELALRYARAGQCAKAQPHLQAILTDHERHLRQWLESVQQPPMRLPAHLIQPLTTLITTEPEAWYYFLPPGSWGFVLAQYIPTHTWLEQIDTQLSLAVYNVVRRRDLKNYPTILSLVRHWQQLDGSNPRLDITYTLQEITEQGLLQRFYDPQLSEAALAYREDTDWNDWNRREHLIYAAAMAAQAQRFQEAERLRQEAGWMGAGYHAIYEAGYAVGLARQGRFRQAARQARSISSPVWRAYALAEVAAELKRRGR